MTERKRQLVEAYGDSIPAVPPVSLRPDRLFGRRCSEVWMEIGPGSGEHLLARALALPEAGFLASEPYLNGLASILARIQEQQIDNIRMTHRDVREIADTLSDASLAGVYCLFPDPWPKARHHKRRLIQPGFAETMARVIVSGGMIRLATDWAAYADHIVMTFRRNRHFAWTARRVSHWQTPWQDHVTTRYEARGLGDIAPVYLEFRRK